LLGKAHSKTIKDLHKFNKIPIEEILVEKSTYQTSKLSKRLREAKLLEYKCSSCGLGDTWNNQNLTLHIDHINGISDDHRLSNLRFLCPNCHSQTSTYCGRNAKKSLSRIKIKNKTTTRRKKEYFCLKCGNKIQRRRSKQCVACAKASQLKANYPEPEILIQMIKDQGYLQVGRTLGVSDNAIRKHLKVRGFNLP